MKSLSLNELSTIEGGWSWTSFVDGVCGAVTVVDAYVGAAAMLGAATGNPLAGAVVVSAVACAGWTVYRLSQ